GNICRSPMAEFVMKDMTSQFHSESRATSNWEQGNPIYSGTQKIFQKHKIPYDKTKTSQQISPADFEEFDVIIGMASNNVRDLQKMAPAHAQNKIFQFA
ncbi:low molecular weight phosphotyrosine protein phosphatase, partial [Streptococcus suis]